jgi:hypothetical protein
LSTTALCALSLVLFGWETWHSFLAAATQSHEVYESGRISFGGLVSPFGAMLLLGGSSKAAWAAQAAATLAAALLVAVVWRRGLALPIRAAVLAAATLVAIPVVLIYDLMLTALAAAWLIREKEVPASWEKAVLAALFVLCLDPRGLAQASHIPVAPLIAMVLVALTAAHAIRAAAPATAQASA